MRLLAGADHMRAEAARGRFERVRNGPELTSRPLLSWRKERKSLLVHIQPGRPMRNGHVKTFNGRFRDQYVNAGSLHTRADARSKIATWRDEYTSERPPQQPGIAKAQ
jgi:putative transposase